MTVRAGYILGIVFLSMTARAGWGNIDCFDPIELDDSFENANVVLIARLTEVKVIDEKSAISDFFFEGKEALKGALLQELALRVHGGLGDSGLVGFDYLLFLQEGQTRVEQCEPTVLRMRQRELMWYSNFRERRD